jgi:pimeloyl-ACP methyl ester carboxylesterase
MTADARDLLVPVAREHVVLRARFAGDPSAPALLLLHGLGEDLEVWWERGWAQELSRRRVIAFDARGHGASSKPHEPARYAAGARIADAAAVLDAAGCDAADVVGYSMGGWTAMLLAAGATERVRSLVVGGAPATGQSLERLRRALASSLEGVLAAVERQCGPLPETARRRFLANDRAALAAVCSEDRPALIEALAGFTGPAMFYVGGRDPLRAAVAASARRLRWQCRIIEGRDHFELAVTGAALPAVVDFLAEADPRDVAVRNRPL